MSHKNCRIKVASVNEHLIYLMSTSEPYCLFPAATNGKRKTPVLFGFNNTGDVLFSSNRVVLRIGL